MDKKKVTKIDVIFYIFCFQTECQYESMLVDADGNQIGVLEIFMNLEDHGPYYNDKTRQTSNLHDSVSITLKTKFYL